MSIYTPEVASKFGALDSDAFVDGEALSAHLLRAIAMSGNRLTVKGQPLINLLWPWKDTTTDERGTFAGIAWPFWTRLMLPVPVPKRPILNRASGAIGASFTDDATVLLQIATTASPFRADVDADHPNVVAMTGAGIGTFGEYSFSGIEISPGTMDRFEFWIKGGTGDLGDEGTYGPTNEGGIDELAADHFIDNDSTWVGYDIPENYADGGHMVQFVNADGKQVVSARRITLISKTAGGFGEDQLSFTPSLTAPELSIVSRSLLYRIVKATDFRLFNIAIAATARSV